MADKKRTLREGYRGGEVEIRKGYTGGQEQYGYTGQNATKFVPPQGGSALLPKPPVASDGGGSSSDSSGSGRSKE